MARGLDEEIAGVDRVVDVLVGIEIGKSHIVRQPVGEILQTRGSVGPQGGVHGLNLRKSGIPYSPVVE